MKTESMETVIQREPFDYTKWQENLFEGMTIEEIARKAAEFRKNNTIAQLRQITDSPGDKAP